MTKRQLDKKEKEMINKNLPFIEDELDYSKAMLKRISTTLEIAPVIYKKQIADMEKEKKGYEAAVREAENAIATLKDQLKNGVEQKETKNEK